MLKNNIHYFNISILNKESLLDTNYMFLEKHRYLDEYIEYTKKIKEYLTTIKTLNDIGKDVNDVCFELYKIINNEFSSKSEFCCFMNACDITTNIIKQDFDCFKKIIFLYLKNRKLTDSVPEEWIQAIIDKGASRSKGVLGENKLIKMAIDNGFTECKTWDEFKLNKKSIAKFSKNNFDFVNIKENTGINLNFNNIGKMLDIIIKSNNNYIFIEAKHLKENGGEQDKQISELINIINKKNDFNNVYYGAFLDGMYSNLLLSNIKEYNLVNKKMLVNDKNIKILNQANSILKALFNNKNSFWFNTFAFNEFLKDFS